MKVDDRKTTVPRVDGPGGVQPAAGAPVPAAAPIDDPVSVSDTARRLAQLRAEVGDVSPDAAARQEKVQGLRAVMAKGQYSADLGDVARKMVREVLGDLLG